MFCPRCGAENPDEAQFCAQCGNPLPQGDSEITPGLEAHSLAPTPPQPTSVEKPTPPSYPNTPLPSCLKTQLVSRHAVGIAAVELAPAR